jgi:hypothetical protein
MAAHGTGSSTGRDRGSGSAVLAHAGRRSAAVLGLATVLLLAVAIGTRGSPVGAIPIPAAPAVWQTATYALVGIVIGAALGGLPIALMVRRRAGSERPRLSFWQRMVATLSPVLLLAAIAAWWMIRHPLTSGAGAPSTGSSHHPGPASTAVLPPVTPPPQAAPTTVLLVALAVGVALALLVTVVLVIRSRPSSATLPDVLPGGQPAAIAAVDAALDALGAEVDPRRAVIAAYAAMERLLGAAGSPRRLADAPTEHLERSLVLLGAGRSAARRLVELFQRARFSLQEIDEPVRQAALDALAAVRRDLEPA